MSYIYIDRIRVNWRLREVFGGIIVELRVGCFPRTIWINKTYYYYYTFYTFYDMILSSKYYSSKCSTSIF